MGWLGSRLGTNGNGNWDGAILEPHDAANLTGANRVYRIHHCTTDHWFYAANRDNREDLRKAPFPQFSRRGGLSSVSLIRALFSNLNSVFSVTSCSKLRLHEGRN